MENEERVGKGEERKRKRARKGQMVKKSFGQRRTGSQYVAYIVILFYTNLKPSR